MAILGDSTAISMNVLNTVEAGTIKKRGGTSSQFLMADGSVSTHSGVDKVGTVTSVAASAGAGISVSGSPITTSGTLTITNTGVRSVTAGSTANVIKVNTNGSEANITINNVAHATSADSATTASKISTEAGTDSTNRPVFFAYSGDNTRVVYDNDFKYNPGTNTLSIGTGTLTATQYSGNAATATNATNATNATTATNLANKPSLTWSKATSASAGSTLTVTAGGKTSDAITIDKVRAAFTADSATNATTATNLANKPSLTWSKATSASAGSTLTVTAGGKESDLITIDKVRAAFTADSATNATNATNATTATNLANKPSLTWTAASSASAGSTLSVTAGGKTSELITIDKVRAAFTADSATKATQDGSGNTITSTYVKKSGDTMTGSLTATSFVKSGGTASQFLMADGSVKTLSTTVSQNDSNPVSGGAVWSFCDEFEEVTATALNYLNLSKQDKLTAGSGIALTQASGSAIISVAGVPREVLSATHAGLVQLRNNNRLVPGQWYRITDYNPTFVGSSAFLHSGALISGHHRFDILVMATSYNTLAPDAYACRHEGDTYFQHCLLDKWKLKYSLTDPYEDLGLTGIKRYTWCDAAADGGIIYEMIDENNNQCPYDFKNVMIQVYCRINAGKNRDLYQEKDFGPYGISSQNQKYYTFNLRSEVADNIDLSVAVMDPSWGYSIVGTDTDFSNNEGVDIVCNNTIKPFLSRLVDFYPLDTITVLNNTNPGVCQRLNEIVIDYRWDGELIDTAVIRDNVFDNGCHSMFYLSGTSWTTLFFNNYFGKNCHDIMLTATNGGVVDGVSINIGNECNNIIINSATHISIGDKSYGILIGKNRDITVGRNCYNMSLPEDFLTPDGLQGYRCYFGDECSYIQFDNVQSMRHNVFGCSCNDITLNNQSANNTFGDYCSHLSLTRAFDNRFGNYCGYITCPENTSYNTFGDRCKYISVRTTSSATYSPSNRNFSYCTFDSNTCYLHLIAASGLVQRKHVLCSASGPNTNSMVNFAVSTYATSATTADMYIGRLSNGATSLTERSPIY